MIIAAVVFTIFSTVTGFLLYMFPIIKVCGDSMHPTYFDGDVCISRRLIFPNRHKFLCNDVYVYHPPTDEQRHVLKRLSFITVTDRLYFLGDNSTVSFDSRSYGAVNKKRVVAKVIKKVWCSNHE